MADNVAAITGLSAEEAASYLEMAGGDVEGAVGLFFSMQDGGGGSGGGSATAAPPGAQARAPAHDVLIGAAEWPASWLEQGFEFSAEPGSRGCLVQYKNGPCGVLAVVNAEVVAHAGLPHPSLAVDDAALCAALGSILWRTAAGGKVTLASWAAEVGGAIEATEFTADGPAAAAAKLLAAAPSLKGRGGCCLFCYACVLTRGIDAVRADAVLDGGAAPLVVGPHALCGTELCNLMLCGVARTNVSAYGASGGKVGWRPKGAAVGLLSRDELESGLPLADELKSPSAPVWVLHGGDHFTLAWIAAPPQEQFEARVKALFAQLAGAGAAPNDAAARALERAAAEMKDLPAAPAAPAGAFDLLLWNGLPPNRALRRVRVRGGGDPLAPAPAAPPTHASTHYRLSVGEVESVVQASAEDKKASPGAWLEHRYEVNLVTQAVADEDQASAPRPADAPQPLRLEPGASPLAGAAWRCASCYNSRFKTMCFGENAAPSGATCKFCGLAPANAGWTLWRRYAEMPAPLQRRVDRTSGPKVLAVLRTRWPNATLSIVAADGTEAKLGTKGFDPVKFGVPAV